MIVRGAYVTSSDAGYCAPCPFCGSRDTDLRPGGRYSYDQVYCNGCLTEFTFYPPAGEQHGEGGPRLGETLSRWEGRSDPDPERCPFCGWGLVEFDGLMNYSMFFADAYCPACRVRFEFQRVKRGKVKVNDLRKAREAFGRRS